MHWKWWLIAVSVLVVAGVVTGLVLGLRHKSSTATKLLQDSSKASLDESQLTAQPHATENKEAPTLLDEIKNALGWHVSNDVEEESKLQLVLERWLDGTTPSLSSSLKTDELIPVDVWLTTEFSKTLLKVPFELTSNDGFGQSMDSVPNVFFTIGCPGRSTAVVYDIDMEPIQQLTGPTGFGRNVKMAGEFLVVQANDSTHLFRWGYDHDDPSYTEECKLDELGASSRVVSVCNDGTMWVYDYESKQTTIWERTDRQWYSVSKMDVMIMDASVNETDLWLATNRGLQHWSRDRNGTWICNAVWLENTPLTSVHVAEHYIVLGEAHINSVRLVSKTEPYYTIAQYRMESELVLFSDKISVWNNRLFVTAPCDNGVYPWQTQCGSVFVMDTQLIAEGLMRSERAMSKDMFGSSLRAVSDRYILIGAPGESNAKGSVYVVERK